MTFESAGFEPEGESNSCQRLTKIVTAHLVMSAYVCRTIRAAMNEILTLVDTAVLLSHLYDLGHMSFLISADICCATHLNASIPDQKG